MTPPANNRTATQSDNLPRDGHLEASLRLGLECLPDQKRGKAYAQWLAKKTPAQSTKIQAAVDCYQEEASEQNCLDDVLKNRRLPRMASYVKRKKFCGRMVAHAEKIISDQGNRLDFLRKLLKETTHHLDLPTSHRESLHEIASFYASIIPSHLSQLFEDLKNKSLLRETRWETYEKSRLNSRSVRRLNPASCENKRFWKQYDLKTEGFPYIVPIFLPKKNAYAWPLFEEALKLHLLFLKFFLAPKDLHDLFSPEGRPGLSIYISTAKDEIPKNKSRCGVPRSGAGGNFDYADNRISIFLDFHASAGDEIYTKDFIGDLTSYLYHELGHGIFSQFIPITQNRPLYDSIVKFYEWSIKKAIPNPDQRKLLKSPEAQIHPEGLLGQLSIENSAFLPNIPYTHLMSEGKNWAFGIVNRYYSAIDVHEFFAKLIEEYLATELMADDLPRPFLAPFKPSPHYARYLIMKQFFAPRGLEVGALTEDNIEAAFRSVGIPIELTPPSQDKAVRKTKPNKQSSKGLSLPLRLGVHYLTSYYQGEPFHTDTASFGLGAGYISTALPTGVMGGIGVAGDYYPFGEAPVREETGTVRLDALDANLWILLGANLGEVQLLVQPGIGLRHTRIEREKQTHLLLGGEAGLMVGRGLSVLFQPRFQLNGDHSLGGVIQADIPSIARQ